jgi:hypothetical protein
LNAACESTDAFIEVLEALDDEWMVDYSQLQHTSKRETGRNRTILDRVGLRKLFVSLKQDGKRFAFGIAVLESGWVGLFGIVTSLERRRQGLVEKADQRTHTRRSQIGADTAYLQIYAENLTALNL